MDTKTKIGFIGILLLGAALRFWQIGSVPPGISNDEAGFIYDAYSIWKTGKDVTGRIFPLSFNLDNSFPPAIVYIIAPVVGILGPSPVTGRVISAFSGTISVVILYFLVKLLYRDTKVAFLSMAFLAVSPWHIFISRIISPEIALCFFLGGTIFLYRGLSRGSIYWSLPFYFLSFHAYHPVKIFLAAFLGVFFISQWDKLSKIRTQAFAYLLVVGFFYISFYVIINKQQVTRQDVLVFSDFSSASRFVNWERTTSLAPLWVSSIFSNKLTYFIKVIRDNYIMAFSPDFLFLNGEASGLFNVHFRGLMYFIDLPLLFLGVLRILRTLSLRRKILTLGALLVAPLPSALSSQTYVMRSAMMVPFLVIILAYGCLEVWTMLRRNNLFRTSFALIYCVFVLFFVYQYFFRYPIYGAESYFESSKELAELIGKNKEKYREIINYQTGPMYLLQYGIFNHVEPAVIQKMWSSPWPKKDENVTFVRDCLMDSAPVFDPQKDLPPSTLYIVPPECHKLATPSATIVDRGEPLRSILMIFTRN